MAQPPITMRRVSTIAALWAGLLAGACRAPAPGDDAATRGALVARLGIAGDRRPDGFAALRTAFVANNPGYDLEWRPGVTDLPPHRCARVAFVQGPASRSVAPTVGDALLLRAGEAFGLDAAAGPVDLLVFTLPVDVRLPTELPAGVRPDWDPRITDTPGGCATEGDAYRRILLTWREDVGPYVLHALNAHRVRIRDSFTHYHPRAGGFDEFYLVQAAPVGAELLTSTAVAAIEREQVDREHAGGLFERRELQVGDLVYLPRGTAHRGRGGALVQVISVPGFVPNAEIGLDHHLWAINRSLGLIGADAIPFHLVAARTTR